MLVAINGVDITKCVQSSTYMVDEEKVYDEWQDANKKTHREIIRSRIKGSFDVVFFKDLTMEFDDFISIINACEQSGVIPMTVYVTNRGITKNIYAFYDMKSSSFTRVSNDDNKVRFTFSIEEQ